MSCGIRLFIRLLSLAVLWSASWTPCLADFETPPLQPDAAARLSQQRLRQQEERERLLARQDRLYNEITQPLRSDAISAADIWICVGIGLSLMVVMFAAYRFWRAYLRRRRRRSRRQLEAAGAELIERDQSSWEASHGRDHVWAVLGMLRDGRSRRHRRHNSHRSRRSAEP